MIVTHWDIVFFIFFSLLTEKFINTLCARKSSALFYIFFSFDPHPIITYLYLFYAIYKKHFRFVLLESRIRGNTIPEQTNCPITEPTL